MKKGLAQFIIVGLITFLAALAITQGDVGLAGLGWVRASTEAATPAATAVMPVSVTGTTMP